MIRATDIPATTNGAARPVPEAPSRGHDVQRERLLRRVLRLVHCREGGVLWFEGSADAGKSRMPAFAAEGAALTGAMTHQVLDRQPCAIRVFRPSQWCRTPGRLWASSRRLTSTRRSNWYGEPGSGAAGQV